jgi:hypothetical protein
VKRFIVLLLTAMFLGTVLMGCGGGEEEEEAASAPVVERTV